MLTINRLFDLLHIKVHQQLTSRMQDILDSVNFGVCVLTSLVLIVTKNVTLLNTAILAILV